jgi:hypothetical protein
VSIARILTGQTEIAPYDHATIDFHTLLPVW